MNFPRYKLLLLILFAASLLLGTGLAQARDDYPQRGHYQHRSYAPHHANYAQPNANYNRDRGYYHNGYHYNYYHNGNYYHYYHNGAYYNYYYNGRYYNYYYNGAYYMNCSVVAGYWLHGIWFAARTNCW